MSRPTQVRIRPDGLLPIRPDFTRLRRQGPRPLQAQFEDLGGGFANAWIYYDRAIKFNGGVIDISKYVVVWANIVYAPASGSIWSRGLLLLTLEAVGQNGPFQDGYNYFEAGDNLLAATGAPAPEVLGFPIMEI